VIRGPYQTIELSICINHCVRNSKGKNNPVEELSLEKQALLLANALCLPLLLTPLILDLINYYKCAPVSQRLLPLTFTRIHFGTKLADPVLLQHNHYIPRTFLRFHFHQVDAARIDKKCSKVEAWRLQRLSSSRGSYSRALLQYHNICIPVNVKPQC